MPVHEVIENGRRVGWRWGEHGKLYASKAKAQAQARAIYASGYHEDDAGVRQERRRVAMALRPNWHAEMRYKKRVAAILAGVHDALMALLEREILPPKVARQDANDSDKIPDRARRVLTPRLRERVAKHVREKATPAYDEMAQTVNKKSQRAMTLIGIPLRDAAAGVVGQVATMRENNLRLISEAGRGYVDDLRDVLTDPKNEGLRVEALRDKLRARGGVSLSRARLIAVDQTLKLSSALTQARQRAAGVSSYRWSTSLDERVRGNPAGKYPNADPSHWDLEGQEFDWDDPPNADTDGGPAHPGEAINCRCVAIPVFDEDELEEDERPSGVRAVENMLAAGLAEEAANETELEPLESEEAGELEPDEAALEAEELEPDEALEEELEEPEEP